MSACQFIVAKPPRVKAIWNEIPRHDHKTGNVLMPYGVLHPPSCLRYVNTGPLAPSGRPALAYLCQTRAEPWTGVVSIALEFFPSIEGGAKRVYATSSQNFARSSVRFGQARKKLVIALSLGLALDRFDYDGRPVWYFSPGPADISGEIPDVVEEIEIVARKPNLYVAKRWAAALTALGRAVRITERAPEEATFPK